MKKEWLIAGALLGCTAGMGLLACSSSTTGNNTTGTPTSSASSTSASTTGSGGGTTGTATGGTPTTGTATGGTTASSTTSSTTTTTTTGTGGSAQCSTVTTLHPPKPDAGPGSIYCPFSATMDGGSNEYCTPGTEHCCETPEGNATPTACQPIATACMTGSGFTDWQCEDPVADCGGSTPVCCAPGASIGLGTPVGQCGNYAHTMTHTACVAAGACTGITMCTSTSECPTGQTCTPFGKAGASVGGCM